MATSEMRSWVTRVLGVELAQDAAQGTEAGLRDLLGGLGDSLRELRSLNAPELPNILTAFKGVSSTLNAPNAAERVNKLVDAVTAALRNARQRDAQAAPRLSIDLRKLLVTWHNAQSAVTNNIVSIGQAVLARDDVQKDPRLPKVQAAVADLPKLVPQFGSALDDLFNNAINAGSTANVASDALVVIADYRKKLDGATRLLSLQEFAAKDMGSNAALVSALSDALGELERELKAAA